VQVRTPLPRDRLLRKLASLTPVHGALDQIVRASPDMVRKARDVGRIVRQRGEMVLDRLVVENRAGPPTSRNPGIHG